MQSESTEESRALARERGQQLRAERISQGLSLNRVAVNYGSQPGYLSQLESGKILDPGISSINKISAGYGLDLMKVLKIFEVNVPPEISEALKIGQAVLALPEESQHVIIDLTEQHTAAES